MRSADLPAVKQLSDRIYPPALHEALAVYAEKLAFCPDGCFVLAAGDDLLGYLVSHPWRAGAPPALDRPLRLAPAAPDCFYLHDLALLPQARGHGAARAAIAIVLAITRARALAQVQLVAVGDAAPFWHAMEFRALAGASPAYGPGACLMALEITSDKP